MLIDQKKLRAEMFAWLLAVLASVFLIGGCSLTSASTGTGSKLFWGGTSFEIATQIELYDNDVCKEAGPLRFLSSDTGTEIIAASLAIRYATWRFLMASESKAGKRWLAGLGVLYYMAGLSNINQCG